jgi:hypothetical protein
MIGFFMKRGRQMKTEYKDYSHHITAKIVISLLPFAIAIFTDSFNGYWHTVFVFQRLD